MPVTVRYGGIYEAVGQAVDLSARGMFFTVQDRIDPGSPVEIVFRLPRTVARNAGVWLRCKAKVVRLEMRAEGKFGVAAHIVAHEIFRVP